MLFNPYIEKAFLQGPYLIGALMALGLLVGFLTGLFGVGGGFMLTPLLTVVFGVPYNIAIGSDLSYTIGAGSSGMSRHMRLGNFEPRTMFLLAGGAMIGAVLGGTLNASVKEGLGDYWYNVIMNSLFVMMLTLTAWVIGRNKAPHRSGKSVLQRLPLPPRINLPRAGLTDVSASGICLIGLTIGVLQGMMGIGGGVLYMPLLVLVVGLTPHQAIGTSLGVVVFGSVAGAIIYGLRGDVNLVISMSLLISSVFGIQIGAWISSKLHATHLKRWFAVLVTLVAITVAVKLVYVVSRG